jgi:DNA polymerase III epsilon subunit-like protein
MEQGMTSYIIRFVALIILSIAYMVLHEAVHGIAMKMCGTKKVKYGFTGLYAFAGSNDFYGKKSYIQLAYPEKTFLESPPFPYYYDSIKEMLTAEDTVIFGYAPENDASFLRSEFERYSLAEVDFKFNDVQRLFRSAIPSEDTNLCSLSNACEELNIDTAFITHKSCDDAFATMLVLKEITKKTGKSVDELLSTYEIVKGELIKGEIRANYFKPKAELKPGEENYLKGVNKDNFRYLIRRLSMKKGSFKICFSWLYEYRHYRELVILVDELAKLGYKYTSKLSEADFFVKKPPYMRGICRREKEIYEARNSSFENNPSNIKRKLKVFRFCDMLELLGMTEEQLREQSKLSDKLIEDLKNGKSAQ